MASAHPLLIDTHNDWPWRCRDLAGHDWDVLDDSATQTSVPRLRAGGVGAQFWSVFVEGTLAEHEAVTATLEQIDAVYRLIARHDDLEVARTADDVERIHAAGRIASLMGAEGGHSIASSLAVLRMLHALGVGYMTLTHNEHVPWADCAAQPERLGGLSEFGREVVAEMNRLGMLVDLAHTSVGTMRDALDASRAPVIFTHSGARSLADHPRNVPDDVLTAMAAAGGVCCATFVPQFCSADFAAWDNRARELAVAAGVSPDDFAGTDAFIDGVEGRPVVTVEHVADHVERLRDVAGVDHVGIGGDYDGTTALPEGLEDVSTYPRLLEVLSGRGWSTEELAKLAGGNVLRVMRAAEDVAQE
ncbi:MAG: dipeptidase [Mobilicoccus sp.]|nr:dipeptidase [Mobilicoccus sp.]